MSNAPTRLAIALFLGCFVLGQADKQVMGLLALPVQQEFRLSDSQLGLLQGVAFAMAYAIGGVPIAHLLDRGRRVRIAAICVGLWSVATILCGVAGSFAMLFALRAATAIAEAGLPPAFFSILSQSGNRRQIARSTSVFMLAPFVGGGLVLVLGGLVLRFAAGQDDWPAPWRVVFFAVGVPGLLLAPLLAAFVREPARAPVNHATTPSLRGVVAAIFVRSRFLRLYYLALLIFTVFLYAVVAWYPAYLARQFGLSPAEAGRNAGLTYLVAGVLGTLSVGLLATLRRDTTVRSIVRGYFAVGLLLIPATIALTMVATVQWSLLLYGVYAFLSAAIVASMAVPIQLSLGNAMLARGFAIFSLLTSALGGSIGPLVVGVLSDRAGMSLAQALAVTGGVSMSVAALLFLLCWRSAAEEPQMPRADAAARAACS
ncbi:MFS transporter [Roseiterribacter gracilis]|uniref:MFS transporter n=1 Tax=Roseiterribacter gracilis TaxID=2812848 RepID=A0A8S8XCR8_9PROT|nr:MFS transporter [Rhodospirillales bacterium TMPK1]